MDALTPEVEAYLVRRCQEAQVPEAERPLYRKWARFYLDFCRRHEHPPRSIHRLRPFLSKLSEKGQRLAQQGQAEATVWLMLRADPGSSDPLPVIREPDPPRGRVRRQPEVDGVDDPPAFVAGEKAKDQRPTTKAARPEAALATGSSWKEQYDDLVGAIRLRKVAVRPLSFRPLLFGDSGFIGLRVSFGIRSSGRLRVRREQDQTLQTAWRL